MRFLCLVYGDDGDGAERLGPASIATTVRVRDGRTQVSDGPFRETPEELAAFLVVECDALSEALERAGALGGAAVEVRPQYVEAPA